MGVLNCEYITTGAGATKLITVTFGFISGSLLYGGYETADWFKEDTTSGVSPSDKCVRKAAATMRDKGETPCPEGWLITVPAFCVLICLMVSLALLLLLLCLDLDKNGLFSQLDMIFHYTTGFVLLCFSGFIVAYAVLVFINYPCDQGDDKSMEKCHRKWHEKFAVWTFLIAAVFTFVTGLAYCSVGPLIKKGSSS